MMKYPYKDEDLKVWIYDSVPEAMELATSEKQLRINTLVLYKARISSLAGLYIAENIKLSSMEALRQYLKEGGVYVKKIGV